MSIGAPEIDAAVTLTKAYLEALKRLSEGEIPPEVAYSSMDGKIITIRFSDPVKDLWAGINAASHYV